MIALSGLLNNRHEECLYMSCCGDFSEFYTKLFIFSLQGFREKASFSSQMIPSQKDGKNFEDVHLESCSQALEETKRNQDLVQFNVLESNIHKGMLVNQNFSLYTHPFLFFFLTKDSQTKANLFAK